MTILEETQAIDLQSDAEEIIGSLGCAECHGSRVIDTELGPALVPMGNVDVVERLSVGYRLRCGHKAFPLVLREGQWLKLLDGTILQGKGVIPIKDRDALRCRTAVR